MNPAAQKQSQPGTSGSTEAGSFPATTQKRQAPDSSQILGELKVATSISKQKESFEQRKKRILERCGCL